MLLRLFHRTVRVEKFLESSKPGLILFIIIAIGLVFTLGSMVVFLKLRSEVLEQEALHIDLWIEGVIFSMRSEWLTRIMLIVTNFGGIYLGIIGTILTGWLIFKKHSREAVVFLFILGMGLVLNIGLKAIIQRDRPILDPLIIEKDYSFPSGHAMNSFVFYTTVSYLVYHFTRSKKLTVCAFGVSALFVSLIGFSRIYLGVHYASDVIAGYVAGFFWFNSVFFIQKTLTFYRLFRESKF